MGARKPAAGDVVVTKVVDHYHIGRLQADLDSITAIAVANSRTEALAIACESAMVRQRVFLYDKSGTRDVVEIDCAKRP